MAETKRTVRIWDLPTRIVHWAMALSVAGAFVSVKTGAMAWHGRFGLAMLGLLVFRLAWGFVGSTYARFGQFLPGPSALRAYLRGEWRGEGHNPLGALSVLAMLAILLLLAATGLFANDDVAFEGPLYALAGKVFSDRASGIHRLLEPGLILLVLAHLGAIAYYVRFRRATLIMPMITGLKPSDAAPARGGGAARFSAALILALAAVWEASGAWLPEPAPAPAVEGSAPAF